MLLQTKEDFYNQGKLRFLPYNTPKDDPRIITAKYGLPVGLVVFQDETPGGSIATGCIPRKSLEKIFDHDNTEICNLVQHIIDRTGCEIENPFGLPLTMASSKCFDEETHTFGAIVLLDDTWMKIYCISHKEDFIYILPASVHELLVVDGSDSVSEDDLLNMVKSVNNSEVDEKDRLSYDIYKYDHKKGEVSVIKSNK